MWESSPEMPPSGPAAGHFPDGTRVVRGPDWKFETNERRRSQSLNFRWTGGSLDGGNGYVILLYFRTVTPTSVVSTVHRVKPLLYGTGMLQRLKRCARRSRCKKKASEYHQQKWFDWLARIYEAFGVFRCTTCMPGDSA